MLLISADLSDPLPVARQVSQWLETQDQHQVTGATLINNAGVILAISPLYASDPAELTQALRVGLEAPMVLTAAFLAGTRHWSALRRVLKISSGLGRRPMACQSAYCAAKAGMDHFTRCLARDETLLPNGARVCSLASGVIDTDMQVQMRSASPAHFPDQGRSMPLYTIWQLTSAHDAAARALTFLQRDDFVSKPVTDVRC